MKKILKNEDWLSFGTGLAIVILAVAGLYFKSPKFEWKDTDSLTKVLSTTSNLLPLLFTVIVLFVLNLLTRFLKPKSIGSIAASTIVLFVVAIISMIISGYAPVKYYGFEYVIFALVFGILIRNVFGVPQWLKDNLHTEFLIKTGLVVLGAGIIFGDIVKAGSLGLIQALVVVLAVWFFAYWIGGKLKVDDEMRIMISSAVSICGVSAAIASAGAIKGDGKKLSYVVSLVLIIALPMLIILPLLAKWLGLTPAQAGAWLGGTIDTTGAVVASGSILGEEALKFSTIVKFSQNVLIGFAAVAISLFWAFRQRNSGEEGAEKVNFRIIWERFPKFVLGFIMASLLFSFLIDADTISQTKGYLKGIQTAIFAVAFVGIGLETDFRALVKTGNGKPAWAYVIAQLFNIIFTLLVAWLLFR